jgi:hypothetical protein
MCLGDKLHVHGGLDGSDHKGDVYVQKVFMSCDKPSCKVDYKFGWAVREARKIADRLLKASVMYGEIDHVSVSVPLAWYCLSFDVLKARVWAVLAKLGYIGGPLIFHRDRFHGSGYSDPYFGFHFHYLGFAPERNKCRSCKLICFNGCGGFVDRVYRYNELNECFVKLLPKRKTITGTAWYELHHSSYRRNVKRASVVQWVGVCSYRKLKVVAKKYESSCPSCGVGLVKGLYFGSDLEVLAWLHSCRDAEVKSRRSGWFKAVEDGRDVWVVDTRPFS